MTITARIAAVALMAVATGWPALSQDRQPLLYPDTTSIYQRVLSKPGAVLLDAPDGAPALELPAFQPLLVYAREDGWLEVGRGRQTGPEGWLAEDRGVDWEQNIVVAFANPAGRERQLMFDKVESLDAVIFHESAISQARKLREQAEQGEIDGESGVVSIEPAEHVDIQSEFYLLPILDWQEFEHPDTFEIVKKLKIASLPLAEEEPEEPPVAEFKTGLVFAIDTTSSMEPFIEETRAAVRAIYDQLRAAEGGDRVHFGVVGFRDDPEGLDGIDYRTKVYVELSDQQTEAEVLAGLGEVKEAEGSTRGFPEDSIAGVVEALELEGWDPGEPDGPDRIDGRFVLVISDASPKSSTDPHAESTMDAEALYLRASENGTQLMAMHILTPDGISNHRVARQAYSQMTRVDTSGEDNYLPVPDGTREAFAEQVRTVVDRVVTAHTMSDEEIVRRGSDPDADRDPIEEASLAMRLAYLGRIANARAPEVFEAWTIEPSLEDASRKALDVRLLVTKNQLSTMADVLSEIAAAGEESQNRDGAGFFSLLRGALARIAQDPNNLVTTEFETLGDAVGEFLGRLPYQSDLMEITEERWENMGSGRRELLDRVQGRLALYRQFHDNPDHWIALYEGAPDGEHVFAMPFGALP